MTGVSTVLRSGLVAAAGALLAVQPAAADEVADFYRGKTITMLISSGAGGGYDALARIVSRHMGKYIPGNPSFVNMNMPGAGGIRAANHLFARAPKDGSVISATYRGIPFEPRFRPDATRYDPLAFTWLGSAQKDTSLMLAWHTSKVETWQDMKTVPIVLGSTRADQQDYAVMAKSLLGLDATKIVWGYGNTNEVVLAMERGEVDGITAYSISSLRNYKPDWIRDKKVKMLMQFALEKHPDLPDVPLVTDLARNDQDRRAMELMYARQTMARPYIAPPGVPKARADVLRAAFMKTMQDPGFLADAGKARIEVSPIDGSELLALVRRIYGFPDAVFAHARDAIGRESVKVQLTEFTGTISQIQKKGRRMKVLFESDGGKNGSAGVDARQSQITVAGREATPEALKPGMACRFASATAGGVAFTVSCE